MHAVNTGSVRNERIQTSQAPPCAWRPGNPQRRRARRDRRVRSHARERAEEHPPDLVEHPGLHEHVHGPRPERATRQRRRRRRASDRRARRRPKLEPPASDVPTSPPPSPSPSGHASHPFLDKPLKNHAAVSAWPRETAAADPGSPRPSASGCAAATMTPRVTAPVAVHATIGVTPSLCPMNTPSAALDAAKNGSPSARTATYVRTMGATSGGTCRGSEDRRARRARTPAPRRTRRTPRPPR